MPDFFESTPLIDYTKKKQTLIEPLSFKNVLSFIKFYSSREICSWTFLQLFGLSCFIEHRATLSPSPTLVKYQSLQKVPSLWKVILYKRLILLYLMTLLSLQSLSCFKISFFQLNCSCICIDKLRNVHCAAHNNFFTVTQKKIA